jgi:NAD(P)-dependent dehydrogenase (short-subunit alcohol dehydrogenase family)
MGRIAIVTGGTRGIGAAISQKLEAMGMTVVANYAGNAEKAKAFEAATGIMPPALQAARKSRPKLGRLTFSSTMRASLATRLS